MTSRRRIGFHGTHIVLALVFAVGAYVLPSPSRAFAAPTAPSGYAVQVLHQYGPGYLWGLAYRPIQKDLLVALGPGFESLDPTSGTILKTVLIPNGNGGVYNLAVAADGSVAGTTDGAIELFDATLTLIGSIPQPGTARLPRGIAYDSTGALYVANGSTIYKYAAPVTSASTPTTYRTGFSFVEGVAIDEIDGLFVADSNSVGYSRGGYAPVTSPVGVASIHLYPEYAYVTSAQCGFSPAPSCTAGAVYRTRPSGAVATLFSSGLVLPTGVALDPDLSIFVADRKTGSLWKFTPPAPTAAVVTHFTAVRHAGRVDFRWRLLGASRVVGFNLYSGRHRLSGTLIPWHRRPAYAFGKVGGWSGPFRLGILFPGGREILVQATANSGTQGR